MRHSIWNATQLVQGTPRLAASHLTCDGNESKVSRENLEEGRETRGRTLRAWQVCLKEPEERVG
jgi:hypothetical protein